DRVDELVGLLDEVAEDARMGLLAVPGAPVGGPEARHDFKQVLGIASFHGMAPERGSDREGTSIFMKNAIMGGGKYLNKCSPIEYILPPWTIATSSWPCPAPSAPAPSTAWWRPSAPPTASS